MGANCVEQLLLSTEKTNSLFLYCLNETKSLRSFHRYARARRAPGTLQQTALKSWPGAAPARDGGGRGRETILRDGFASSGLTAFGSVSSIRHQAPFPEGRRAGWKRWRFARTARTWAAEARPARDGRADPASGMARDVVPIGSDGHGCSDASCAAMARSVRTGSALRRQGFLKLGTARSRRRGFGDDVRPGRRAGLRRHA